MNFLRRTSWIWGTILLADLVTLLPYWVWNGAGEGFGGSGPWRFPVAPNAVFDSYLYFQQMSLLKAGIITGAFNWFTWPILGLMRLLPQASIPEIWMITRWFTIFLGWWAGAWCIRRVTGADTVISRWLSLSFWFSFLLVISLRPGAYSWYQPLGFLGIGLLSYAADIFLKERRRWIKAGMVGAAAVASLYVWPWFFLFSAVWVASFIASQFVLRRARWWYGLLAIAVAAVCAYAILLVSGVVSFTPPASFAFYDRNGIGFSHAPLISNTVVAIGLWLGLLITVRTKLDNHLGLSWIALLVLWLSPPLIGLDLLNDHFIILVAMLAWISLGVVITPSSRPESNARDRRISLGIAIFASFFFIYILTKALGHIGKFEPYTIHLSIWFSLAAAGWLRVIGNYRQKPVLWCMFGVSLILGATGLVAAVQRNAVEMPLLRAQIPLIDWVSRHVPADQAVCADLTTAKILAAHAGRKIYPSAANLMLPETDEVQHRRLQVIGATYDVEAAKDEIFYPYLINGVRTGACNQFSRLSRWLEKLGVSRSSAQRFVGCRAERAATFEREVMTAIREKTTEASAFRAYCPWVAIPDDKKGLWSLPGAYEEIRIGETASVWHVK